MILVSRHLLRRTARKNADRLNHLSTELDRSYSVRKTYQRLYRWGVYERAEG